MYGLEFLNDVQYLPLGESILAIEASFKSNPPTSTFASGFCAYGWVNLDVKTL